MPFKIVMPSKIARRGKEGIHEMYDRTYDESYFRQYDDEIVKLEVSGRPRLFQSTIGKPGCVYYKPESTKKKFLKPGDTILTKQGLVMSLPI